MHFPYTNPNYCIFFLKYYLSLKFLLLPLHFSQPKPEGKKNVFILLFAPIASLFVRFFSASIALSKLAKSFGKICISCLWAVSTKMTVCITLVIFCISCANCYFLCAFAALPTVLFGILLCFRKSAPRPRWEGRFWKPPHRKT